VFRIVDEDSREPSENPVEKALRLGAVVGLANHTLLIARDGAETAIDDSAALIRRDAGPVLGVVLVFRDVTEARASQRTKARLAAIVETSEDAIFTKDVAGTIQSWNAGAQRLFGYPADEIVGRSIKVLVPPDRLDEEAEILDRLRKGQLTDRLETVRVAKDGRRVPVSVTVAAMRDADGRVVGASKIVRDMTAAVAALEAIAREKDLLATTLASIGDGVIVTDAAGRVTFVNAVAIALTGWSQEDAAGRPLAEVFRVVNEDTRRDVENPALRAMRDGVVVGLANHSLLVSRGGDERPIDDSAAPIRDARGRVAGSVLVFRDVTARRRNERELRESREKLQAQAEQLLVADRRKNEFLATLAHELRNPLAPIKNSVAVMQMKAPSNGQFAEALDVVGRQVRVMARLLDDLLDVNRIGRDKLVLRRQLVELSAVVSSAVETARPYVESRRHALSIELPSEPVVLDADPVRLAQVFANLLNNAAKYMDPGGRIWLKAVRQGDRVAVSVGDGGIGIPADALPTLFEMFSQHPLAFERSQGGVGIGLSLAKGLVELHGGTIEAKSDGPGTGSEFTVRLPVARGAAALPSRPDPAKSRSSVARRILVVDDLADCADSLATLLRELGHIVHTAYDGERAVETAESLRPEVVIVDLGMPGVNGYEICRRLRAEPWGGEMLIVALTGWGQGEDRWRSDQAGFDHHLLKPVDVPELVVVLADVPARRNGRPTAG
jgi:PAS domain S-box-containing protein